MYDYFDNLEQHGGDRGALYRTSEPTGELTILLSAGRNFYRLDILYVGYSGKTIKRVRRECAASGTDFSSPAKHYKSSRQQILVDDFDREAIRRRIYQGLRW